MLGQSPVGGDLAAEHREQRRRADRAIDFEMVVARHRRGIVVAVVEQRAHAGIGPHHVFRPYRLLHVVAGDVAEIGDLLGGADGGLTRIDGDVGRADQREGTLVGDDEDNAVVAVLQDEGVIAFVQARHDDVAALDEANTLVRLHFGLFVEEMLHPRARRVHQATRLQVDRDAAGPFERDVPELAIRCASGRHAAMAGEDPGAHFARRFQVADDQPRIVHPGIGVDEALLEGRFQADAELGGRQVDGNRLGQGHVPVEMIIEEEAEPQHPARAQVRLVRQHETQRPGEVWRFGQQHLAFLQRLAHQPEFVLFQIAQAAVDELGCLGRGGACEIVHFAKANLERPSRCVAGNTRAVDAAADHEQVERTVPRFIHGVHIARLTEFRRNRKRPHGLPA